jgi:hypothetical protein
VNKRIFLKKVQNNQMNNKPKKKKNPRDGILPHYKVKGLWEW